MKDYIINWVKHLKCSLCSRQVLNKVLSIIKMRTKDIHNKSSLSSLHMITCNVGRRNEMQRSHMNIRRSPQWKEIINIIHITDKLELSAYMMYKKVKYNNCWWVQKVVKVWNFTLKIRYSLLENMFFTYVKGKCV